MVLTTANFSAACAQILSQPHELSFDTETYGLLRSDRMFSLIIGSSEMSWYFNFKDYPEEGVAALPGDALLFLRELFADTRRTWFAHNAKFDMWRLHLEGISIGGDVFCTKAMGRVLKNNHMKYSLEASAERIGFAKDMTITDYITKNKLQTKVQIPGKDKETIVKHYDKVPFALIAPYGETDAVVTYKLGMYLKERLAGSSELYRVYENELALTKSVFEMEKVGITIDPAYTLKAWRYEEGLVRESKEAFLRITGHDYTTKKSELVQIFRAFGDEVELNEKNNYVLDKAALAKLKSPAAAALQKVRYHEKRITSFYSTFMYYRDHDNVIRPDYHPGGTETGRFSMSEPNLQQLSKKDFGDGEVYSVRGCFVPRPGTCFVQVDYSQQEYRIMADYAGQRSLVEKIMAGEDVHTATADLVGINRDQAKTLNFAILYGSGADNIASMLGISKPRAYMLKQKYFDKMPMVDHFIQRVISTGKARGHVHNWLGRKCYIDNKDWAYILPNHLIQGGGADVTKFAINRTVKLLKNYKSKAILTVHDSLLLEMVPEEFYLIEKIKEIFETAYEPRNGIVLTVDIEHSWMSLAQKDMKKGWPVCQ